MEELNGDLEIQKYILELLNKNSDVKPNKSLDEILEEIDKNDLQYEKLKTGKESQISL